MRAKRLPALLLLAFLNCVCLADPTEDAIALKNEALEILKKNSNGKASTEEYATCILKLEKAAAALEAANMLETELAQEVNASLFWARRFSDLNVLKELDKMKKADPAMAKKAPAPAKPVPPKPVAPQNQNLQQPIALENPEYTKLRTAEKAFVAASHYANSHKDDDYAVAMRWFQVAATNPGTDQALKALELARQAQQRFSGKAGTAEEVLGDTPEMSLIKEGDFQVKEGNLEAAFPIYQSSIKMKETLIAHRRLGGSYYQRAQQLADILKPKFEQHLGEYQAAYMAAWEYIPKFGRKFNPDHIELKKWTKKMDELKKEKDVAYRYYESAEKEFAAVLKLAPENKDFEAAGYLGLCQCVRPFSKMKGSDTMKTFTKNYTPENDSQRSLTEFCKAEIERISKGK